ncbi:nucleoside-diphosphate kinase [bacterium]|nr:nucleoside-diphosphate kinase [candidate division CSSED10-310 bacterium]
MNRTLVLLKPDAVRRGMIGRIISRFEDAGLRITQMRVLSPPGKNLIRKHYDASEEWLSNVGRKTIKDYESQGLTPDDVKKNYGTMEESDIGRVVQQRLVDYLSHGTVIALAIEGNGAITKVRKLIGFTIPAQAEPGTIRGDFGCDSTVNAAVERRSMENLVHASDSDETAEREMNLWFSSHD